MVVLCKFLLYVFRKVLFITTGKMTRIIILLYYVISTYNTMISLAINLRVYFYEVLLSRSYLGHYLSEFINNYIQFMRKMGGGNFHHSFTSPFFFRLDTTAFENLWDVQASMLLLLCILDVFQVLFRVKQLFQNIIQRFAPSLDICGWQGMWDSVDKYLGQWTPLVFLNLIPE